MIKKLLSPAFAIRRSFRTSPYLQSTSNEAPAAPPGSPPDYYTPGINVDFETALKALQPTPEFLASLDAKRKKHVEKLLEELKLYVYMANKVPRKMTPRDWEQYSNELKLPTLQKRVQFLEFIAVKQRRRYKDELKEQQRKEANVEKYKQADEAEKRIAAGEYRTGLGGYTLIQNPNAKRMSAVIGSRFYAATRSDRPIIGLDLQFLRDPQVSHGQMMRQAGMFVAEELETTYPLNMRIFNKPPNIDDLLKKHLGEFMSSYQDQKFLPPLSSAPLLETFADCRKIVYISKHARKMLEGPLDADAYILPVTFDQRKESIGAFRELLNQVSRRGKHLPPLDVDIRFFPLEKYMKLYGSRYVPIQSAGRIFKEVYTSRGDWKSALFNHISKVKYTESNSEERGFWYNQQSSWKRHNKEERVQIADTIKEALGQ
ncbi:unnamed protein product, partial [Mesorhabditis spiculigera]